MNYSHDMIHKQYLTTLQSRYEFLKASPDQQRNGDFLQKKAVQRLALLLNGSAYVFPAVIQNDVPHFLYRRGDVSDTRMKDYLAYFKGVEYFRSCFCQRNDESDRDRFVWEYTYPLLSNALERYRQALPAYTQSE